MAGWCDNYLAAARVRSGERLRIVVDEPFAREAEELAEAARTLGAEARIACYPAARPILEPTAELMDTAEWADASITLMQRTYVEEQPAGRALLEALLSHGGRALASPGIDHETLLGELSQPMADVEPAARRLLAVVEGARELHIRGAAGTDLRLRVDGRRWVDDALPLEPGGVANFPGALREGICGEHGTARGCH